MIIGFTWKRNIPTAGELRNPVSLVRGSSVPDRGVGFDLSLNKVWDEWAKVEVQNARLNNGESSSKQTDVTHVVIVRRHPEQEQPELRDFVVYRDRLLRILDFRELGQRAFYWVLACNDEGPLSEWTYDNPETPENPNDVDNPQEEPASEDGFPFWG